MSTKIRVGDTYRVYDAINIPCLYDTDYLDELQNAIVEVVELDPTQVERCVTFTIKSCLVPVPNNVRFTMCGRCLQQLLAQQQEGYNE